MGKDDWAGLAIIGIGLWFLYELAKKQGDVKTYRCWNCKGMIKPGQTPCPWCGAHQEWSRVK
jgi:hypothetical protein